MFKAKDAQKLYETGWSLQNPTVEELSKYLEDGAKLGRYEFVVFYDNVSEREEMWNILEEAGWSVNPYNGGDGLEITW